MNDDEVFTYSIPEGETPSEGVIKTVATLEDCDPTTLDTPLYTVIDPDALDQAFKRIGEGRNDDAGRIVFMYYDYEVTVRSSGSIGVRPPTPPRTENAA